MWYIKRSVLYLGTFLVLLGGSFSDRSPAPLLSALSHVEAQAGVSSVDPALLPGQNDWDAGTLAFSSGSEGQWDRYLWGGFANSLIKKGNTYYLYYQGSPSYDDTCGSVAHRAIGVATSTDGIHWVKSPNNPVITWSSQGSIEEGAVSAAAWLGGDGKVYVYYGANSGSGCTVRSSARLAVSGDGENFTDAGQVLSGSSPNVWGAGDEISPVGAYSYNNRWHLFYIPNGVALSQRLGVASGATATSFSQSTGLNNATVPAWGPVSVIADGPGSILVTNPTGVGGALNLYGFHAGDPSRVQLLESYSLPNCAQASVLRESGSNQWMMSCRDQTGENYYIRRAAPIHWANTVGVFRPSNGLLYLKNSHRTGFADVAINYGVGGDYPIAGDWNGDGVDTIGVYRNGSFYLRNSNTIGYADLAFAFGSRGDQPIAGDWDGDGIDTVGVYRSSAITFYLRNSNTAGAPQLSFGLGMPGDVGIAGDWNGDGKDTTGVFRPSNGALYLKNTNATGFADIQINYGIGGDRPVTGDWNNDGVDTIGVLRGNTFFLRNSNSIGYADLSFALGFPGDMPIAGNWDGKP